MRVLADDGLVKAERKVLAEALVDGERTGVADVHLGNYQFRKKMSKKQGEAVAHSNLAQGRTRRSQATQARRPTALARAAKQKGVSAQAVKGKPIRAGQASAGMGSQ
jgi:hypothetical protein